MRNEQALKILEALLYMTDHPLSYQEIGDIIEGESVPEAEIKSLVNELRQKWSSPDMPLQVVEVAGGVQMATRQEMAPWIRKLYKERLTVRLSPSALETLSIIAYKQPIARSEIEQIRGVEVTGVVETLLERRLIKVVGRKETIGRPLLYGTTPDFLRQFGLNHLTELPDLESMAPQKEAQLLINVNQAATQSMDIFETTNAVVMNDADVPVIGPDEPPAFPVSPSVEPAASSGIEGATVAASSIAEEQTTQTQETPETEKREQPNAVENS